jgi:hypothetical protein
MVLVKPSMPQSVSTDYTTTKGINAMNYQALEGLARQRSTELYDFAERQRATARRPGQYSSLRVRTGWKLVDLGLKLAVPAQRRPAALGPVRS